MNKESVRSKDLPLDIWFITVSQFLTQEDIAHLTQSCKTFYYRRHKFRYVLSFRDCLLTFKDHNRENEMIAFAQKTNPYALEIVDCRRTSTLQFLYGKCQNKRLHQLTLSEVQPMLSSNFSMKIDTVTIAPAYEFRCNLFDWLNRSFDARHIIVDLRFCSDNNKRFLTRLLVNMSERETTIICDTLTFLTFDSLQAVSLFLLHSIQGPRFMSLQTF